MKKTYAFVCAMVCMVLIACNGGKPIGDPVKEHRIDRRDTVASLFPGEEDLAARADSLDTDSLAEPTNMLQEASNDAQQDASGAQQEASNDAQKDASGAQQNV